MGNTSPSTVKNIWNVLVATLTAATADGQPLDYIKAVYQGVKSREDIPQLPAIVLYPITERESQYNVAQNNFKRILYSIGVTVCIQTIGGDVQVTGDTVTPEGMTKGIGDMVSDVKNVINSNVQLTDSTGVNNIINQTFPDTQYVYDDYPNQYAEINLTVEFIVQYNQR